MIQDYLQPITPTSSYSPLQLGSIISAELEEIAENTIVIVHCPEYRSSGNQYLASNRWREELYALSSGQGKLSWIDAGTLLPGNTLEDTRFALEQVISYILDKKAYPVIIGGSMDLCVSGYNVLQKMDKPLQFTAIDSTIELEEFTQEEIHEKNYLSYIFTSEPSVLFQFSNIGYQTQLTHPKILDTLEEMDFEAYRLGSLTYKNIEEAEPILRSTDYCAINMNAVESYADGTYLIDNPNGFNSREICQIGKYIGLSQQNKMVYIGNHLNTNHHRMPAQLLSQIIWYIAEGLQLKQNQLVSKDNYLSYTILQEGKEIEFVQDHQFDKWWIKIKIDDTEMLFPCSVTDYKLAAEGDIPERYWKLIKKFF